MTHISTAGTPTVPATHDTQVSKAVYDLLITQDLAAATRFAAGYVNLPGNATEQLVRMNRYWRRQLDRLNVDTIAERECLMDDCELIDWLRHFQRSVLPTVLAHELPIL